MISLKVYEASWCGPCQRSHQLLKTIDNIPIEYIDISSSGRRGILGLPTIEIYKDGEVIDKIIGEIGIEDINKLKKLND